MGFLPVKIISFALEGPISLVRFCVPPPPGIMASFVSANPIFASSATKSVSKKITSATIEAPNICNQSAEEVY